MKKIKILFGVLVVGAVIVVVAQNLDFFLQRYAIGFDIGLVKYQTPNLAVMIYLLFFFFAGLLIAFLMGLSEKFQSKKSIRELTEILAAEKKKNLELEAQLAAIQGAAPRDIQQSAGITSDALSS